MSYYKNQPFFYIIGTSASAATLTASYNDNTSTSNVRGYNIATIYVEYTPAENDGACSIQIEAGIDAVSLFPKTALIDEDTTGVSVSRSHIFKLEAISTGVAVKRRIVVDLADRKIRISAKESVVGSAGVIKIILQCNEE